MKLSPTMLTAIKTIRAAGGEAHPERGGWWRSAPVPGGHRISWPSANYPGQQDMLVTQTIHSLIKRGLLIKIEGHGNGIHSAYRLTAAADSIA